MLFPSLSDFSSMSCHLCQGQYATIHLAFGIHVPFVSLSKPENTYSTILLLQNIFLSLLMSRGNVISTAFFQ